MDGMPSVVPRYGGMFDYMAEDATIVSMANPQPGYKAESIPFL
jgi:hypothetical protein